MIKSEMEKSIINLGPRYTPKVNVETDTSKKLNAFVISDRFIEEFHNFILMIKKKINKICLSNEFINFGLLKSINDMITEFIDTFYDFEKLENIFLNYEFSPLLSINLYDNFIFNEISDIEKETFNDIRTIIDLIEAFFYEYQLDICKSKILVVKGKAGVGKSHLIADFCKRLNEDKYACFLHLGQFFKDGTHPWEQIVNQMGLGVSYSEFLSQLDIYACNYNKKVVIVIDALNEGDGRVYWSKYLQPLVNEISEYDFKLILTIRNTYENLVLPKHFIEYNHVPIIEHIGFNDNTFDAISEYCNYYEIDKPIFPIMNDMYVNPLILKLTCESLKKRGKKKLERNYTYDDIFENYIEDVNLDFSQPSKLNYQIFNLVDKALLALVDSESYKYGQIDYESAFFAIKNAVINFCGEKSANEFLDMLISSNVLNLSSYKEKSVVFSYEKLGDYYTAKSIIIEIKKNKCLFESVLSSSKRLEDMIRSEYTISYNRGVLEILSVLIPKEFEIEIIDLFELESNDEREFDLAEIIIESFLWRKVKKLNNTLNNFINNVIFKYYFTTRSFIEILVKLSFEADCALNMDYTHSLLSKLNNKYRDSFWTIHISNNNSLLDLLNWTWESINVLPLKSVRLLSLLCVWSFTSTNRKIRDYASKLLANLIIIDTNVSIEIFDKFSTCDDDYVLERLMSSLYGGFVHTKESEIWENLIQKVYDVFFLNDETHPNIYVRKFSYLLITGYCKYNKLDSKVVFPKLFLRGTSKWLSKIPSNDEIDEIENSIKTEYGNTSNEYFACHKIIKSMTTEYGRGTCAYGDFGRYVFESKLRIWENQFNIQDLSNAIIYDILKNQYDYCNYSNFDCNIAKYQYGQGFIERIGKKYQWIGFHQIVGRLLDNFIPYKEHNIFSESYVSPLNLYLKKCDNDEDLDDYFRLINGLPDYDSENKIIGVEKIFIENPFLKIISEFNEIDPTYIWKDRLPLNINANFDFRENILGIYKNINEVCDYLNKSRIQIINNIKYFVLDARHKNQNDNDYERDFNYFLWHSSSCLLSKDSVEDFIKNHQKINGNGIPIIEHIKDNLFNFYSSDTYYFQKKEMEDCLFGDEISYFPLVEQYFWEAYQDESLKNNESICLNIPADFLIKLFNMKTVNFKEWDIDQINKGCMCYIDSQGNTKLLFDYETMLHYLRFSNHTLAFGEYIEYTIDKENYCILQNVIFDTEKEIFKTNVSEKMIYHYQSAFNYKCK